MNPEQYETKVCRLRAVIWWGDVAWVSTACNLIDNSHSIVERDPRLREGLPGMRVHRAGA